MTNKKPNYHLTYAIEDSKVVNEIGILTQYIMQITEQTNLLSLNAAIEAARAGEDGVATAANEGADGTSDIADKAGIINNSTNDGKIRLPKPEKVQ